MKTRTIPGKLQLTVNDVVAAYEGEGNHITTLYDLAFWRGYDRAMREVKKEQSHGKD